MKRYVMSTGIYLAILIGLIFAVHLIFDFNLGNVAFTVGGVTCLITYGGRGLSALRDGNASAQSGGTYIPSEEKEKFNLPASPSFTAGLLILLFTFLSMFFL